MTKKQTNIFKDSMGTVKSGFVVFWMAVCTISAAGGTGNCPDGWSEFDNSCYFLTPNKESWSAASKECYDLGGHLVRIETKRENDYVEGLAKTNSRKSTLNFWIDGTDIKTEGNWRFGSNNAPVGFSDFFPGQPDQGTGANCAVLWQTQYMWDEAPCDLLQAFICEKKIDKKEKC